WVLWVMAFFSNFVLPRVFEKVFLRKRFETKKAPRCGALVSLSEGDSTKYQKSTARSFLTLESPQKTENKAR
ncbi:TPA: hypothetical protein ACRMT8_006117, partial [Pseudomonas aeruginosa]